MTKLLSKISAVVGGLFVSASAFAGQMDTQDAFYGFYDTVNHWAQGPLGTGLATTMLLVGAGTGVARNSPMPALSGIAGAAFLHWGPGIITNMMANGMVF